ncbi:hypothetical protein GUJ93_ZPchr0013g35856 [Zizania palustris]|uniref:Uncharacterized protein n=1 Tax=Zizania palustris TaxID=103762 RepID=A0A8J5X3M5_ZIZPA|nr:hypothetical protein GUJ93_ZPchr0013g35856 [Zizania palustris]
MIGGGKTQNNLGFYLWLARGILLARRTRRHAAARVAGSPPRQLAAVRPFGLSPRSGVDAGLARHFGISLVRDDFGGSASGGAPGLRRAAAPLCPLFSGAAWALHCCWPAAHGSRSPRVPETHAAVAHAPGAPRRRLGAA